MSTFFLISACLNLVVCVLCVKDSVLSGALITAVGFAWCVAHLLGWVA